MPRQPRFNLPNIPQHIIQRGNNREPCFYSEKDFQRYIEDLKLSATKYHCKIHAYVLMTNHVHLLVTPLIEDGVSQMMQSLGRRYVRYFNQLHNRTGTLWEGRYKSCLIDSDIYLLTCMCYIEMNPVRAKMVEHPGEYVWSSYQVNAQLKVDKFITYHRIYLTLGETKEERIFVYRELFQRHLDNDAIHQIRDALNQEMIFGCSSFKNKIEALTKRSTRLRRSGRPRIEEAYVEYTISS